MVNLHDIRYLSRKCFYAIILQNGSIPFVVNDLISYEIYMFFFFSVPKHFFSQVRSRVQVGIVRCLRW